MDYDLEMELQAESQYYENAKILGKAKEALSLLEKARWTSSGQTTETILSAIKVIDEIRQDIEG